MAVIFADLSEIWPVLVIVLLAATGVGVFWRVTRRSPDTVALERRVQALQSRVDLDDSQLDHLLAVVRSNQDVYPEISAILLDELHEQERLRQHHRARNTGPATRRRPIY